MASIVDSIRSVYQDNYSLLKLGIFSYLIFLIHGLIASSNTFNILNLIMWVLIVYMYLGFSSIIINHRINQSIAVLPPFDPVLFFNAATQSSIIALPFAIVGFFVVNAVVGLFNFEGLPQQLAIWIIRYFAISIFVSALINFAEKFNLKQGFNVSKILSGVADVLVYTMLCLILIALYSLFVVAPTLYLIYSFFDIGPLFKYVSIYFVTMNLAFASDYWGQLHFDIESKNNYY